MRFSLLLLQPAFTAAAECMAPRGVPASPTQECSTGPDSHGRQCTTTCKVDLPEPVCPKQCDAENVDKAVKVPACSGGCYKNHEWCDSEQPGQCKWSHGHVAQECMDRGGCLDYAGGSVHNCFGANPTLTCIFGTHDILDQIRMEEDRLQADNVKYEVIFNHPGFPDMAEEFRGRHMLTPKDLFENGPVVIPSNPNNWAHYTELEGATPFSQFDCENAKHKDGVWLVDGIEYDTCAEGYRAAQRMGAANYPEVKFDARPFDPFFHPSECPNTPEKGVKWEFEGRAYETCRAAVDAAVAKENEKRPADQQFKPQNGCEFGIC